MEVVKHSPTPHSHAPQPVFGSTARRSALFHTFHALYYCYYNYTIITHTKGVDDIENFL